MAIFQQLLAYSISTVVRESLGCVIMRIFILVPMVVLLQQNLNDFKINQTKCIHSKNRTKENVSVCGSNALYTI